MLNNSRSNIFARGRDGVDSGDLHGNVAAALSKLSSGGVNALGGEGNQNANLAAHVDVRAHSVGLERSEASELGVLAHHMDAVGDNSLDGLAVNLGSLQGVEIGRLVGNSSASDFLSVSLELLVHAHEVGLAVELDESARLAVLGNQGHNGALVGGAAGLLGNSGKATGAQNVNSAVHVAVGLSEGLLALHHACAGHFAQFLDHGSGDVCHLCGSFLKFSLGKTGPASLFRNRARPLRIGRKHWTFDVCVN